jgi:hypothetical protein
MLICQFASGFSRPRYWQRYIGLQCVLYGKASVRIKSYLSDPFPTFFGLPLQYSWFFRSFHPINYQCIGHLSDGLIVLSILRFAPLFSFHPLEGF